MEILKVFEGNNISFKNDLFNILVVQFFSISQAKLLFDTSTWAQVTHVEGFLYTIY